MMKGYIPDSTEKNTAWSLKVFNEWRCSREGNCPADLLTSGKFDDLNYWIPRFVKNVPERIVQKVTSHRSLEALRSYKRISVRQNQEVSKILMTNVQSQSVAVKGDSQQMFRSLGGINHCSIGNVTFNIETNRLFQSNSLIVGTHFFSVSLYYISSFYLKIEKPLPV